MSEKQETSYSKEKSKRESSPSIEPSKPADNKNLLSPSELVSLVSKLTKLTTKETKKDTRQKLSSLTIEGITEYILKYEVKNIIVLTGAGISTSAGVPDFRSPGTGLYDNVSQYNLPDPMAVFDISYFKKNPEPFYKLAKDLFPSHLKPTPCHYLIRLMAEKGLLLRWYTQNIDSLEFVTGISEDKLVTAHGCHHTSTCLSCHAKFDLDWIMNKVFAEHVKVAHCDKCDGVVKPDIVFFGENLPERFFNCSIRDFPKCDLLIIMGTSLVVHPFAGLVDEVNDDVPRLLINLTEAGRNMSSLFSYGGSSGLCYRDKNNYRDVFWQGTTDDGAWKLAELLGWKTELEKLIEAELKKIDEKEGKDEKNAKPTVATTDSIRGDERTNGKSFERDKSVDEEPDKS
ncbi:transcriptional regulator [Loa loa]|uniref:NAD-dependent protein deacetylase n=1 Tax=Loa loa TaxID=7209 RepID=A0A1I7VAL0_LOALO|nr:transcriptional regulator [Loa loa]EFO23151.1 transcriptional regulator [Loa loa]